MRGCGSIANLLISNRLERPARDRCMICVKARVAVERRGHADIHTCVGFATVGPQSQADRVAGESQASRSRGRSRCGSHRKQPTRPRPGPGPVELPEKPFPRDQTLQPARPPRATFRTASLAEGTLEPCAKMTIPLRIATMSIATYAKKTLGGAGRHGDGWTCRTGCRPDRCGKSGHIVGAVLGGLVFSIAAPRMGRAA